MTQKKTNLVDDFDALPITTGPGEQLRDAREKAGLSLDDIAARLRLRLAVISAIESDDYQGLAGPVFVRGYLRGYSKLVGLEPDSVVSAFNHMSQQEPRGSDSGHLWQSRSPSIRKDKPIRGVVFVIVTCLVVLTFLAWQARRSVRHTQTKHVSKQLDNYLLPDLNKLHPVTTEITGNKIKLTTLTKKKSKGV